MKKNSGKSSEQDFEDILCVAHGKRVHIHRITDTAEVRGMNRGRGRTKKQPSDYIVTEDGATYYAEVKSSHEKTSFPLKNIDPFQKGSARQVLAAGGKYFFFIHNLNNNQWFRVPAETVLNAERRSLRWDSLDEWKLAHA